MAAVRTKGEILCPAVDDSSRDDWVPGTWTPSARLSDWWSNFASLPLRRTLRQHQSMSWLLSGQSLFPNEENARDCVS